MSLWIVPLNDIGVSSEQDNPNKPGMAPGPKALYGCVGGFSSIFNNEVLQCNFIMPDFPARRSIKRTRQGNRSFLCLKAQVD